MADEKIEKDDEKPPVDAPRNFRLTRAGVTWENGRAWPTPPGGAQWPYKIVDIFVHNEDSWIVIGTPDDKKGEFAALAFVPFDPLAPVMESRTKISHAAIMIKEYEKDAVEDWVEEWLGEPGTCLRCGAATVDEPETPEAGTVQ